MQVFVYSTSALVFIFFLILFYKAASENDRKNRRFSELKRKFGNVRDEEMEKPFVDRVVKPAFNRTILLTSKIMPKRKVDTSDKTEKNLKLAGLRFSVNEYNAARLMLAGVCVLGAVAVVFAAAPEMPVGFLIILLSLFIPLLLPKLIINYRIRKRQEEITNQLPDVMDLLCVSIEAGLGFDSALGKISEHMDGILVDELVIVQNEIMMGKPRKSALRKLADQTTVEDLKTFIGSIIQAEQLGIPVNNVLAAQAVQLRTNRRQKAQEKAMKAPVKMMLPTVVFIFPVLIIILLGPTVLQLLEQFGG